MQFNNALCKIYQYRFRPKLVPTLATLMLLPLLISLGQWQAHKAEYKQQLQKTYNQRAHDKPLVIGAQPLTMEDRYRKVLARGYYEPRYQILLDNQIYQGRAGYQVVTPLHLEGSDMRVLVYRGWVPVGKDRNVLPEIETPSGLVEVIGVADELSGKYLELETQSTSAAWQPVWQNLDIKRYKKSVPFPVQTLAVRLDPASPAGGYVRNWPATDMHVETNIGYAFQWRMMALMLVLYYLFTQFRKIQPGKHHEN